AHRRRVGLQQPAVAGELPRLQGDERVVPGHGCVREPRPEPRGGGRAAPPGVAAAPVTAEVLPLLGVQPALGRLFRPGDDEADSAVILSHGVWQSQFGGDPGVLGRTVNLDEAPYVVIGVMPATFNFPNRDVQLWTRLTFREDDFATRSNRYIEAVARLKPGVTFDQAHAELWSLAARLQRTYPETNAETGISFYRMRDAMG